MPTYKYQNISDQDQMLMGYGNVPAGDIIEVEFVINNPNFKLIFDGDDKVGVEASPKKPKK